MTNELTKDIIREKLLTNDNWLIRAVLAIFEKQTASEQTQEQTRENNGVGFNGTDANILSSFAKFYTARGFLSAKQLAIARRKMPKYAGQLLAIAKAKAEAKAQQEAQDAQDAACVEAERINEEILEHGPRFRQEARELEDVRNN